MVIPPVIAGENATGYSSSHMVRRGFGKPLESGGNIIELPSSKHFSKLFYIFSGFYIHYRRKFTSQTSDLRTDAAKAVRAVREEKESEEKESVERRSRCARQGQKVAKHRVFFLPMFWGSGGIETRFISSSQSQLRTLTFRSMHNAQS